MEKCWVLQHLHQVLRVLQEHDLVINPKKCLVGHKEVEYLGHIMSANGVLMDPTNVSTVIQWPTQKNVHGLHGFLGLTEYYHRFIRDYGKLAAPLTAY
ncbi:hypothetical protein C2S51_017810 [Perilla frutescens var. frutescens]|nr:hypothetical protein C2S51_017810 [Perilla frutescens var. frutescens]